jgi:PAS domain S-box-containing protein
MIFTIDSDCYILSINRYFMDLVGRGPHEVIGAKLTDLIEYEHPDSVHSLVERALASAETLSHEETAKIGGKEYSFDSKYKSVVATGDDKHAVLCVSRDITESKKIEEQLFHTEKLASLGSLSAGVAHEINNPIAVILGFAEMLLERIPKGSKEHEMAQTIERQGNNCKRIVENLLAFAKVPKKTTTNTDLIEDLQKVLNVAMNTLVNKKIDFQTKLPEDLPRVRIDGQQLEQVYLNIINNAVSAMDGGGILTIEAYRAKDMVGIRFSDTGHGISRENLDKVFEPFFTTKKVGEGTGLGLSVSYGIIKKYGGDIQVESRTKEDDGESGTVFTVLLPVANGQNQQQEAHTEGENDG